MSITNYIRVNPLRVVLFVVHQSVNARLLPELFTSTAGPEDVNPALSVIVPTAYPATSFKYNHQKGSLGPAGRTYLFQLH